MPVPPYQFIAVAARSRRGSQSRLLAILRAKALTEAAQAIWRGIEVPKGMDRRARPSAARSVRRALSAAPVPAR
jgi:hypothetical protein